MQVRHPRAGTAAIAGKKTPGGVAPVGVLKGWMPAGNDPKGEDKVTAMSAVSSNLNNLAGEDAATTLSAVGSTVVDPLAT